MHFSIIHGFHTTGKTSFPRAFSSNGGMSLGTTRFYACARRNISFCLFRTAVICIRGFRSRKNAVPIDVAHGLDTSNAMSNADRTGGDFNITYLVRHVYFKIIHRESDNFGN